MQLINGLLVLGKEPFLKIEKIPVILLLMTITLTKTVKYMLLINLLARNYI